MDQTSLNDIGRQKPQPNTPSTPEGPARRRPFGLFAIMTLLTLQFLLRITLLALVTFQDLPLDDVLDGADSTNIALIIDTVIMPIILLVVLIGLWSRRNWGWSAVMILQAYGMAVDIWCYFSGEPSYTTMVLNILIVFYLNQAEVRQLFVPGPRAKHIS